MKKIQWMRRHAAYVILYAALGLSTLGAAETIQTERSAIRWSKVPKQALAFYYGWYGNPEVSKRWVHWKNVDVAKKHIDESTHFPVLGA